MTYTQLAALAVAGTVVLDVAVLQKAAYEVRYEIGHRPEWVGVPLAALRRMLGVSFGS